MRGTLIEKSTFDFLKQLSKNNNREWFLNHKEQYLAAKENVENFVEVLIQRMNEHDQIETRSARKSLYRIYNDVRFSNDKTPYNPRFAGYIKRIKPLYRGGYYFWIKPGGSRIACGYGHPNAEDLQRLRQDIAHNHSDWKTIISTKSMKSTFGVMQGEQVKTAPRGFSKDHEAIKLLRYKQYWFERSFTDAEVLGSDFLSKINRSFTVIRPFFDYTSMVLTTDLNGESLFE